MKSSNLNNTNQYYIDRQARFESNARTYPRKFPLAIKSARGSWIIDVEGNHYLDCLAGAGALALGHNHPVVISAIKESIEQQLPLSTLDMTTPVKDRFCAAVLELLPGAPDDWRLQFCGPTGADAVEAALKLAKTVTGRSGVVSFSGAYHGMTHGALSVTGNLLSKAPVGGLMPGVQFLPYPYAYRCPLGLGGEASIDALSTLIERFFDDIESGVAKPAAVIVEAIQGEGGVVAAPTAWLVKLREVTLKHGIILILDEVQSGIGRTGQWFAYERAGIIPDIVVMSKAIGGGLPMAVIAYKVQLDLWEPGAHTGTFRGNQLAMAAGYATFKFMSESNILDHVQTISARLQDRLASLQKNYPCVGDIRGRGLMLGIEIVDPHKNTDALGSFPPDPFKAQLLQKYCFDSKMIIERGGRNGSVLRFLPPLTLSFQDADLIIERLSNSLEKIANNALEAAIDG